MYNGELELLHKIEPERSLSSYRDSIIITRKVLCRAEMFYVFKMGLQGLVSNIYLRSLNVAACGY